MPELIYFATSPQHPGVVKIGRTDRPVEERMAELSSSDYGPAGDATDSVWQASDVLIVEDNVEAEAILHEHFADSRVSHDRELFYSDDPSAMAEEALTKVDGQLLIDVADPDIAIEVFNTFVEYGLIFGGGAIVGRAVHKKLVGHPKYDAALRQAAQYSAEAQSEISKFSEYAQQQWDESEPRRREIYESVKGQAEEKWKATDSHRTDLVSNAKNVSDELIKKSTPLFNKMKSVVTGVSKKRSKDK